MNIENLKPFKRLCITIGNLPTAYIESMSYYEALTYMYKYLSNEVVPVVNNNSEVVKELQDYVKHYFDNLDVQTEIDNKLDEMATSGELVEIITEYVQLKGVIGFNTVADMVASENLIDGSICKTLGLNDYLDGKGEYYKIREEDNDTIDGVNIISLTNLDGLVAEKIPNMILNLLTNKKVIILGDSYANRTNSWADRFRAYVGLNDTNSTIRKVSGVGFYNTVDGKNFGTMVVDDIPFNANEITDIIVCGGYNDNGASDINLSNAFNNFITTCKSTYPNAKIYVGFIGWCKFPLTNSGTIIGNLAWTCKRYKDYCGKYSNVHYLNNVEYSLHLMDDLDSSYFHPTDDGQEKIAINVARAWQSGLTDTTSLQLNVSSSLTTESYITSTIGSIYSILENNISRLFTNNDLYLAFDETTTINFSNDIKIGNLSNGYVQGRGLVITRCEVSTVIRTSNNDYFVIPATLFISEGDLYLRAKLLNRTGTAWLSDTLKYISINGINLICDSMTQY